MINLLPWRENQATYRIKRDLLIYCITAGSLAILLEIALGVINILSTYNIYHIKKINDQLTQNSKYYQQALNDYDILEKIKSQSHKKISDQQQWITSWNVSVLLAQLTPQNIKWRSLLWQDNYWIISGSTNNDSALTHYQRLLHDKNLDSEIQQWQSDKNDNIFTLKVYAST